MNKNSIILVTGSAGMAGRAVVKELTRQGYLHTILLDKSDCDLLITDNVNEVFDHLHPEYVFHIAAKVGGINANNTQSADFIYENLMMECNVIHAAYRYGVTKLIFCGSACIYPKNTPMPIKEEYFLQGALEETNKGYAIAKIAGVVLCEMYRKQYGCNFISVMPTNLYGEHDNFHLTDSHVLPALLRKFNDAKVNKLPFVEVWGTGKVSREFLYIEDLAKGLIFLMDNYNEPTPINIGTGQDISIMDLIAIIKKTVGYTGEVSWNTTYPDGVLVRKMDVTKINSLGWKAQFSVEEGVQRTYDWFLTHINDIRK